MNPELTTFNAKLYRAHHQLTSDAGCNHCFGRGFIGTDKRPSELIEGETDRHWIKCRCLIPATQEQTNALNIEVAREHLANRVGTVEQHDPNETDEHRMLRTEALRQLSGNPDFALITTQGKVTADA